MLGAPSQYRSIPAEASESCEASSTVAGAAAFRRQTTGYGKC